MTVYDKLSIINLELGARSRVHMIASVRLGRYGLAKCLYDRCHRRCARDADDNATFPAAGRASVGLPRFANVGGGQDSGGNLG